MTKKVSLLFFNLNNSIPLVSELWGQFQKNNDYEVLSIEKVVELNQYLMIAMNGILFFKVMNKEDLQNAMDFLKSQKKLIKKGLVRPVCILGIRNKKIESMLAKNGCVDTLDPILKAKTVAYKIDMWTSPIVVLLNDVDRQQDMKKKHMESLMARKAAQRAKKDFIFTGALNFSSDFWILKKKSDCKKLINQYLIKVIGPSPMAGDWVELTQKPGDKDPTWKYVAKDDFKGKFLKDEGTWFFYGSKPEFDWQETRWGFAGEQPHLFFYYFDGRNSTRFKFDVTQVVMAENSEEVLNHEDAILETGDIKYNIELDKIEKEKAILTKEELQLTNSLEGQSKLDDLQAAPLSGSGKTEKIDNSPLSGKGKTEHLDHGPLSGEIKPEVEKSSPLKGKSDFTAEALPGSMSGDMATNNALPGPLVGDINPTSESEKSLEEVPTIGPDGSPAPVVEKREQLADPFAGFDPSFNPFNLPPKKSALEDFASNPSEFQTAAEKKPKKYMNLAEYMGSDENSEEEEDKGSDGPLRKKSIAKEGLKKPSLEKTDDIIEDTPQPIIKEATYGSGKVNKAPAKKLESSPFDRNERLTKEQHEAQMMDALGGDKLFDEEGPKAARPLHNSVIDNLSDKDLKIGNAIEEETKIKPDLASVIGSGVPSVSLESGDVKVVLKQKTNVGNDITFICGFEDFYEDELIVKAPKNSLTVKSEVFANVTLTYNGQKIKVISLGRVSEVEELSDLEDTLVIALKRVDAEKYEKFMDLYQERQESITDFMLLAKGY